MATPNLALGIEYPGIVVLNSRLYEPNGFGGEPATAELREATVAHEVGHQWFYSLVGNDQLDEPWLDESLTQYITYLYYVDQYGEDGANGFYGSLEGRWDRISSQTIPIGLPVKDYTPVEYSAIIYGRGPLFLDTLAQQIGQATLDASLSDYFQQFRFGIATGTDFKAVVEARCGCDLTPLWEEWIGEP